jgi:hypothetical protein
MDFITIVKCTNQNNTGESEYTKENNKTVGAFAPTVLCKSYNSLLIVDKN